MYISVPYAKIGGLETKTMMIASSWWGLYHYINPPRAGEPRFHSSPSSGTLPFSHLRPSNLLPVDTIATLAIRLQGEKKVTYMAAVSVLSNRRTIFRQIVESSPRGDRR